MESGPTDAITGATSYSGAYVAVRLLARGRSVRSLTNHPDAAHALADRVRSFPLLFDDPDGLARALDGVDTLYNTYWVRFPHGDTTHEKAVLNSRRLFDAAARAGVRRIVHVSITNPSLESTLSYFHGKAEVEDVLRSGPCSHAILRPAVLFGGKPGQDILINNVAWLLRRFPFFGIPGDGRYRLQPIHVEDLADLAVSEGAKCEDSLLDAVGPEAFSFEELVLRVRETVRSKSRIVHLPRRLAYVCARALGWWVGDVLLTWDEVVGLMDDLLVSAGPPTGRTRLSTWLESQAETLGRAYANEVRRHFHRRG